MRIGIIGAGEIGATLARLFVGVGHEVVLANSRGPESLAGLVAALGEAATAGTLEDAVRASDVVVLAIPFRTTAGRLGAGFTTALSAALAGGQLEGSQCPQRRQGGVELQRLRFIRPAGRVEVTPLADKLGAAGGDIRAGAGRRWVA
jgi:NADP oxidoreductase coenzyme F420-dependent